MNPNKQKGSTCLFSVEQGMLILHTDEFGPPIFISYMIHTGKLPGSHRAGTDITNFACLNQIMQCFHRFLNRRLEVETMDLQP